MVALSPGQRGQTLLEVLVVVAIVSTALAGLLAYGLGAMPGAGSAAGAGLPALVESARTLGAGSGDGATVAFLQEPPGSAGRNSFQVMMYDKRPNPGSGLVGSRPVRTERFSGAFWSSLGPGPFAIFISSAGAASYAAWSPGSGPIKDEPACTRPLELVVGADPALVRNPPPSPPPGPRNGLVWFRLACDDARLLQQ